MATDHSTSSNPGERLDFKARMPGLVSGAWIVGIGGIVVAFALSLIFDQALKHFFFAYLVSFVYFLSLSLGGLFFVILQHVTKAGWSVSVRRIAECLAASMPVVALLAIPIALPVLLHRPDLYPWADPSKLAEVAPRSEAEPAPSADAKPADAKPADAKAADAKPAKSSEEAENTGFKKVYLNPFFWLLRIAFYFLVWSTIGIWYWRQSLEQDETGDVELTVEMQRRSPLAMIAFAVTLTGASFDLLMSLDPSWSSTIFGVYYFAGCCIGVFSTIIIAVLLLQRAGCLRESVTVEHFHDLGKFLFGFTFFWGYIAFSQYMLMWYANLPEETRWYLHHGATTATKFPDTVTNWSYVCIVLLFGHLLIPFAGLMSRHVKRTPVLLGFWAVWMLVFHWVDLFWVVMPEMEYGKVYFGLIEIVAFLGIGGVFLAFLLSRASQGPLQATHDPRLQVSLEFQNI